MGVVGIVLMRRRGHRAEAWVVGGLAVAYLVYNSGYWLPFGGGTPGPRFLMPVVPFLAVPLALAYRRFPLTTFALAVPSALFMLTATLTYPLIGDGFVGFWAKLLDASNFEATVATPLGAGHGWAGIAPVLALAALAAVIAVVAVRPGRVPDARRAALAVAGWGVAAACVPWILGGESAVGGDDGGAALIAVFTGAGLLVVAAIAALQAWRARPRGASAHVKDDKVAAALAGQRQS
jgi:hypothetical protein